MNYWICIVNEENWEVMKKRKIWGVNERNQNQIRKIAIHDFLIFYVKPKKIGGVFRADSDIFRGDEMIFKTTGFAKEETFPYRLRLEPFLVPRRLVEFTPLISKLSFIKRKDGKWASSIFGKAMRQISENDYELILTELRKYK